MTTELLTTTAPKPRGAHHRRRQACRACGGADLHAFLSLGPQPLANSFLRSPAEFAAEEKYPLDVYHCRTCSLVQLMDVIDAEALFRNYIYVTGTSATIAEHNARHAAKLVEMMGIGASDLVLEVASNDGSLLRHYREHGVRTLGVEPATNIAAEAVAAGIPTVNRFFHHAAARELRAEHGPAKVVIGNNVLAHVDDTSDFLAGCREMLTEDGLAVIEVPYLQEVLDGLEYDTVYHEHLCYFGVMALARLCESVGLVIRRIDHVPVHGGSIRMYAGRAEHFGAHDPDVVRLVRREADAGFNNPARYERFAADVADNRERLVGLLKRLKREGKSVAAYGAPAKGNTLLNYCGIDTSLIPYTVDKNPWKVGAFTPGMHIPVLDVATLLERQPDYVLILAWNFADEIVAQQHVYRERGGRFIVPIPQPRIIEP